MNSAFNNDHELQALLAKQELLENVNITYLVDLFIFSKLKIKNLVIR